MNASPPCSASTVASAAPLRTWREGVPTIVAEALRGARRVPMPLPQARDSASGVAIALARAALPMECADPAPRWLLPHQVRSHARLLRALRRFGGALLSEPVGTGKTYVALAVASTLAGRATCIVPAAIAAQWRATAARLGVPVAVSTHERASRGTLPRAEGLVVVDESHHYRNPGTRRYRHLASWVMGRPVLLVSATPVVNRLADLSAQLALALPDDALAPLGAPSLAALAAREVFPAAIALVVQTGAVPDARPAAESRRLRAEAGDGTLIEDLASLTLSRHPPTARLVRSVLLRAAASSPAALDACLRRYRLLLLQNRDAADAGMRPDRSALRRWVGELPEQTVLWQLSGEGGTGAELDHGDLPPLDGLIRRADLATEAPDGKAARLAELVTDGKRTLVFTASRDTALWLRRWIAPPPAWCTGDAAGVGHTRMPRASVLAGFGPARGAGAGARAPHVLLATDVAAEGLDLQAVQRVVHYDLPWNPARLDQREGRARRLGARHRTVEVVTLDPPPRIEQELRQLHILDTKRRLTSRARLAGEGLDRLRAVIEGAATHGGGAAGISVLRTVDDHGVLFGLTLAELDDGGASWGTTLFWLPRHGTIDDDAGLVASRLQAAIRSSGRGAPPDPADIRWLETSIAGPATAMLRSANAARVGGRISPAARPLLRRAIAIGRAAARRRDEALLAVVDRALRALARGHSAGEALLLGELAGAPDRQVVERLAALPERQPRAFEVRVAGAVLFRPAGFPLA